MEKKVEANLGSPQAADPAAVKGELCHERVNPTAPLEGLTPEEVEMVLRMRAYVAEVMEGCEDVGYERKLVVLDQNERVVNWGSADVDGVRKKRVSVTVDAKFGWATLLRDTVERQMRCYAAGSMIYHNVEHAEVYVYQPREKAELYEAYDSPLDLGDSIRRIIERSQELPELRVPGYEQCLHCGGKLLCPEYREEVVRLPAKREALELLDPEAVERLLETAITAGHMADQVKDYVKTEINEGRLELPNWALSKSSPRSIKDIEAAFSLLAESTETGKFGLSLKEFLHACGVSIGALEELWAKKAKEVQGLTLKRAKEELSELLKPIVERSERLSLKRRNENSGS